MINYFQVILFVCAGLSVTIYASDILILSSVASISHSRWFGKLALLLAQNGHKVVVLDTDNNFFEHPNITHRIMEGGYGWLKDMEDQVKEFPDALDMLVESSTVIENIMQLSDAKFFGCDVLLKSEGAIGFMDEFKGKKFDLIIADTFCECFYAFVSMFGNPPLIPTSPYQEVIPADWVGLFDNPSYVPYHMSSFSPEMNFIERVKNTIYLLANYYIVRNYNLPNHNEIINDIFGPSAPKLEDIFKNNVPLIMTGYSDVIQGAKPLPPSYIAIPGFHVTSPSPLPQDIKKFLDGAKDGAILFSMGSNFKSILMSPEKRELFLSVFKNIPQRIIWKLELENDTNIPSNIMIKKWMPQSDILGHPNVKAFISHGGLLGTQEAIYHGVPILSLPLMFDQVCNMDRLERKGVAIRLYYKQLNRNYIANQVDRIINDPSYLYNMKKLSQAFRDTPQTTQQKALFWIEYVLRHSKNSKKYLISHSVELYWYQRLLLDVLAFYVFCLLLVYIFVKSIMKLIISLICGSRSRRHSIPVQKKKL